jgi:hypothetical protein
MNSQKTGQDKAARGFADAQRAPRVGAPPDGLGAPESRAGAEHHAMTQAARAVMHPEVDEPEWRYVHGALQGADAGATHG